MMTGWYETCFQWLRCKWTAALSRAVWAGLWWVLVGSVPLHLPGQAVVVTGVIQHGGTVPRPIGGGWAVLHEIRADSGAPVDSARTDAAGRYRVTLPRVDSTAVRYVVTAYQDVEYFIELPPISGRARVEAPPLFVYDTTSGGPAMRVERRLVTLFRPGDERGAAVLDIVEVANPGTHTRVAPDSLHPVWATVLPPGAREWETTGGNLVPQAVRRRGDTVQVFAPIWPGVPLRLSHRYALRGSPVRLPLDQPTAALVLLLEDTTATVSGGDLWFAGVRESDGRRFATYRSGPVAPGAPVLITFSRRPPLLTPGRLLPFVVGAAGLAFAWALWVALQRRPLPKG
jgi:hypothetical protein